MFYNDSPATERETRYYDKETDIKQLVYTIYCFEIETPQRWQDEERIHEGIIK
jgi:hypothetical protein